MPEMKNYRTEQEKFWAGKFGDQYTIRNKDLKLLASNTALFSKILDNTSNINSVIEFGANIGLNLIAIKSILPEVELSAIEINEKAIYDLKKVVGKGKVYHQSILDFKPDYKRDFVFTKGVLIHLNPDMLNKVYDLIFETSNKYICIVEYYNPSPIEVSYRGKKGFLFKRDFAGEMLNKYTNLKLIDYGFVYHRDNNFPQDDINWFLLEKN